MLKRKVGLKNIKEIIVQPVQGYYKNHEGSLPNGEVWGALAERPAGLVHEGMCCCVLIHRMPCRKR